MVIDCYNISIVAFGNSNIIFFTEKPTVVYIYRDHNGRHLKAAAINLEDKELSSPPLWKQDNTEAEACMVIPIPQPYGGVIVVGHEAISYHKGQF